jgi:hypothetical protein
MHDSVVVLQVQLHHPILGIDGFVAANTFLKYMISVREIITEELIINSEIRNHSSLIMLCITAIVNQKEHKYIWQIRGVHIVKSIIYRYRTTTSLLSHNSNSLDHIY